MPLWSETLVADIRRDATHEAAIPRGDWDLHADTGYEIPTFDIAAVPTLQRKRVRLVGRATRGDAWPGGYLNVDSLDIADAWKPAAGNDMSMDVIDSTTGRWTVVWGFAAYLHEVTLWGRTIWRTGAAGPGARWVAAAIELRNGDTPIDYRRWNGNAWKSRGAGIGPAARVPTARELAYAVGQGGILPRIIPCYVPNTGGAQSPAANCENPNPQVGDIPGGLRLAFPSTEKERQDWVSDRGLKGADRVRALVFARSMSTDGRGVIAAATVPPFQRPGLICDRIPGVPRDLLAGMPGTDRPIAYEPPVGYLAGDRVGTGWGRYDDIREAA